MSKGNDVATDAETLVDIVEARLRSDIINGALSDGCRLRVESLRQRYDTGATPVREALSRLLVEGLVDLSNNRGFRVPPLRYDDLLDLSRTRALIEGAAVREAAERRDDQWEANLVSAFHLLQRRAARDLSDPALRQAYYDAHHEFHAALLAGCPSPRLLEMQARLENQHSRYYRQLPFERIASEDLIGEHARIVELALSPNSAELPELIGRHVMLTVERIDPAKFRAL
jgi:DNA-binding GntR family transcriptional regulator